MANEISGVSAAFMPIVDGVLSGELVGWQAAASAAKLTPSELAAVRDLCDEGEQLALRRDLDSYRAQIQTLARAISIRLRLPDPRAAAQACADSMWSRPVVKEEDLPSEVLGFIEALRQRGGSPPPGVARLRRREGSERGAADQAQVELPSGPAGGPPSAVGAISTRQLLTAVALSHRPPDMSKVGLGTTHWTEIGRAKTGDPSERKAALGAICQHYWKPVFAYFRRRGIDVEDAKDMTQGFFLDVVLGRSLIDRASRDRGRFRTFLLTAARRYVAVVRRAGASRKRSPRSDLVSLEDLGADSWEIPPETGTPAEAFEHAWASSLIDHALETVRQGCYRDGLKQHWAAFQARVVDPILSGQKPPPFAEIARELGIRDENRARSMVLTVKRRFQAALRHDVRVMVASDEEVDAELQELMNILAKRSDVER